MAISVEVDDLFVAQMEGQTTIRTAFHAAGAATPAWSIDWIRAWTNPEELVEA